MGDLKRTAKKIVTAAAVFATKKVAEKVASKVAGKVASSAAKKKMGGA